MKKTYTLSDFNFDLPENRIAQLPAEKRDESRLFIFPRHGTEFRHDVFSRLPEYLQKGDLLVFNDARVIHARIFFRRQSGARVEVVLARMIDETHWFVITNRTRRLKKGESLSAEKDNSIEIKINSRDGEYFDVSTSIPFTDDVLKKIGTVPLPPYIRRNADTRDESRYQTVYAEKSGAAAAPTAGLHFTPELLDSLNKKGVESCRLTLYVSWGTFSPVRSESLQDHVMHTESYVLPKESADVINKARSEGRRIIAVGTTSLRVIESTYNGTENVHGSGETSIFIYPPYEVSSIDGMITNFHTPQSTLLMLVCAFAGYEETMKAYKTAVEMDYRFFSYGDSMLIL